MTAFALAPDQILSSLFPGERRAYRYASGEVLYVGTREAQGAQVNWRRGDAMPRGENVGHVHIIGGFSPDAVKGLAEACPNLYRVTCAPSQVARLQKALGFLRPRGIKADTVHINKAW